MCTLSACRASIHAFHGSAGPPACAGRTKSAVNNSVIAIAMIRMVIPFPFGPATAAGLLLPTFYHASGFFQGERRVLWIARISPYGHLDVCATCYDVVMFNRWVGLALVMLFIASVAYSEHPSLQTQPQSQIAIVVAPAPILNSASGGSTNTSDSTSACSSQQSSTNDVANRMCPQPDGVRTYYDTSRACDALYDPSRCNGQKSALAQPPTQSKLAAGAVLSACAKNKANCSCGEKQANVVVQGKCVAPNKCRATRSISQDGAECTYSSTSCSSNCASATADGRQQYNQLSSQYAASNNPIVPIAEKPDGYTVPTHATPAPAPAPGTGAPKPAVVPQPATVPGSSNIDQAFSNQPRTPNQTQIPRPETAVVTPNYVAPSSAR